MPAVAVGSRKESSLDDPFYDGGTELGHRHSSIDVCHRGFSFCSLLSFTECDLGRDMEVAASVNADLLHKISTLILRCSFENSNLSSKFPSSPIESRRPRSALFCRRKPPRVYPCEEQEFCSRRGDTKASLWRRFFVSFHHVLLLALNHTKAYCQIPSLNILRNWEVSSRSTCSQELKSTHPR